MQKGRSIDFLPLVICLGGFHPNFIFLNFNSKLKCNCILVVHNDRMYDLTNMSDLVNVSKLADLVILAHMSIRCWVLEKKTPFHF